MSPNQIKFDDYSGGWAPSDDALNGRKNILLRMEGVTLDENGALVMSNGTKRHATVYPAAAHTLFSKYVCGVKRRYLALVSGAVYRDATAIVAAAAGSLTRAAFGVFGDFVLIATGKTLLKDECDGTVSSLILAEPTTAPLVTANAAPLLVTFASDFYSGHSVEFGTMILSAISVQLLTSATYAGVRVAAAHCNNANVAQDYSGSDEDIFSFTLSMDDFTKLVDIAVNFTMATGELYSAKFYPSDITGVVVPGGNVSLSKKRGDFIRAGTNSTYTWANVILIQTIIETKLSVAVASCIYSAFQFTDNSEAALNGTYDWLQVNVLKTGLYEVQSIPGPVSDSLTIVNGNATIIPEDPSIISPETTEIWIFRRGGTLSSYYRIERMELGALAPFDDITSDEDALALGILLNDTLLEVNAANLTDDIVEIVGPVNGRMLYFTTEELLFTPPNQPDCFDPALTIRIAGTEGEVFLWARKVSENTVLIGTTHDVYTLTGTYITQPDGTLDVYHRPLGIEKPPVCRDVAVYKTAVIYYTPFGWSIVSTSGDFHSLVELNTDLLYTGVVRYEYGGVPVIVADAFRYAIAVARDKAYCVVPVITDYTSDTTINDDSTWTRRLEVYDLQKKYWRPLNYLPTLLYAEEDGNVIAFFDDLRLASLDYAHTKLLNFVP